MQDVSKRYGTRVEQVGTELRFEAPAARQGRSRPE
jgi:hypothetical protein